MLVDSTDTDLILLVNIRSQGIIFPTNNILHKYLYLILIINLSLLIYCFFRVRIYCKGLTRNKYVLLN